MAGTPDDFTMPSGGGNFRDVENQSPPPLVVTAEVVAATPDPRDWTRTRQNNANPTKVVPAGSAGDSAGTRPPKRPSMRRSGTVAINRMEHAHDAQPGKGAGGHDQHHHMSIDERMAKTLSRTKTSGIVGTRTIAGIAAFKKANLLDDPESVVHQSLAVQAEFRLKITGLFLAQMSLMFAVMMVCLYTPAINNMILSFEPVHALVCLLTVPVLLAIIFCIKYKAPYSQIAMIAWTVYTGFVAAVCQHKVINDNGMYQIFCCGLGGFLVTTILGQMKMGKGAEKKLFSSVGAGAIGSIVTIAVSATLQSQNVWGGSWGVWLCATVIAITTVMWIS